jgi:hypothetical protein
LVHERALELICRMFMMGSLEAVSGVGSKRISRLMRLY